MTTQGGIRLQTPLTAAWKGKKWTNADNAFPSAFSVDLIE
jgi:hypothetical protein